MQSDTWALGTIQCSHQLQQHQEVGVRSKAQIQHLTFEHPLSEYLLNPSLLESNPGHLHLVSNPMLLLERESTADPWESFFPESLMWLNRLKVQSVRLLLVLMPASLVGSCLTGMGLLSREMDVVGFEPTTSWLQTKHSSNWAKRPCKPTVEPHLFESSPWIDWNESSVYHVDRCVTVWSNAHACAWNANQRFDFLDV